MSFLAPLLSPFLNTGIPHSICLAFLCFQRPHLPHILNHHFYFDNFTPISHTSTSPSSLGSQRPHLYHVLNHHFYPTTPTLVPQTQCLQECFRPLLPSSFLLPGVLLSLGCSDYETSNQMSPRPMVMLPSRHIPP
jgi:hypothetical protein